MTATASGPYKQCPSLITHEPHLWVEDCTKNRRCPGNDLTSNLSDDFSIHTEYSVYGDHTTTITEPCGCEWTSIVDKPVVMDADCGQHKRAKKILGLDMRWFR